MKHNTHLEIETQIKRLLVSELKVNPTLLENTDSTMPLPGRGIGLDSVEAMVLLVSLEEEFGLAIPDNELTVDLFESVRTLANYIAHALLERTT
jgi:acyl carrier protein